MVVIVVLGVVVVDVVVVAVLGVVVVDVVVVRVVRWCIVEVTALRVSPVIAVLLLLLPLPSWWTSLDTCDTVYSVLTIYRLLSQFT